MIDKGVVPGVSPATAPTGAEPPPKPVGLFVRGVQRREAGADPAGNPRVSFTIPLTGRVDDRWRRCFRAQQLDDTGHFRFRLDMACPEITFTCRGARADSGLAEAIRELAVLLDRVNRAARR